MLLNQQGQEVLYTTTNPDSVNKQLVIFNFCQLGNFDLKTGRESVRKKRENFALPSKLLSNESLKAFMY